MNISLPPECEEFFNQCKRQIFEPPRSIPKKSLTFEEVKAILPQRDRMLLVDTVTHLDPEGNFIQAECDLSARQDVIIGCNPNHPALPGALLIEALGQAGEILWTVQNQESYEWVQIIHIYPTIFLKPITYPGTVDLRVRSFNNGLFVITVGQAIFNGEISCVSTIQAII